MKAEDLKAATPELQRKRDEVEFQSMLTFLEDATNDAAARGQYKYSYDLYADGSRNERAQDLLIQRLKELGYRVEDHRIQHQAIDIFWE